MLSDTLKGLLAESPGLLEIWQFWIGLFPEIPIWDPYLAIFTLVFFGMLISFYVMSLIGGGH